MENLSVVDQMRHDVNGDGEDDGAVVLGRDAVQGLKVAELRIMGVDLYSSTSPITLHQHLKWGFKHRWIRLWQMAMLMIRRRTLRCWLSMTMIILFNQHHHHYHHHHRHRHNHHHTCNAAGHSAITSAACLKALLALCSPSAAITCEGGASQFWFKLSS